MKGIGFRTFIMPLVYGFVGWFMVLNATFNNISVILWRSVLLLEKTTDLSQVTDKLYHIKLSSTPPDEPCSNS